MLVRELVEELKKCNNTKMVVFLDDAGMKYKLHIVPQVDDNGWNQFTLITEDAYEREVKTKSFFTEMDTDYLKAVLDHTFRDSELFYVSMFDTCGCMTFLDYEVSVCVNIDGCAWSTEKSIECAIDGDEFKIYTIIEE